ncbi:adenylate cyclase [Rhizobium calliandrae]|uniref:Adenylate cyclase n=1 Tax=Rhizobium calliandrae TaxID=1312182 RepID=A0ABT7KHU8_9HYPH|nr:adenylate cyclase [Rhizobium calliandrae]MDL2408207.1 adenylate cyclase [Rhizobium calliandrae]
MAEPRFPHAGESFIVNYPGITAKNTYSSDGATVRYEIIEGAYEGASAEVTFEWTAVGDDVFLISWQEADGATVVHLDHFRAGQSDTFFKTAKLDFIRLRGTLEAVG